MVTKKAQRTVRFSPGTCVEKPQGIRDDESCTMLSVDRSARNSRVRRQYESWPYPHVPMVAGVREQDTWQLHHQYMADRCGVAGNPRPRIWIAGCGTMQPYTFALANPEAEILATDLSATSLSIARRRCLWHGVRLPEFRTVDLQVADELPQGPFDQIECYGVLMNLTDPTATLRELAARLTPNGILRVMVYPHYGRQRIFQIQRVARLLGLRLEDRDAPKMLRALMHTLPKDHPLRYAFVSYADTKNLAGIVDGFLHAGDRGFTGYQFGKLVAAANLRFASFVHRSWGQPGAMAEPLGLAEQSTACVLHYLDLWQELRTNFVACLVRRDSQPKREDRPRLHPALTASQPRIPLRRRLKRLTRSASGITLPNRVGDTVRFTGGELRQLRNMVVAEPNPTSPLWNRAVDAGVVLGIRAPRSEATDDDTWADEDAFLQPRYEQDANAANPFYAHIFAAYRFGRLRPELQLGSVEQQVARWEDHADPLEPDGGFGLTPIGTWRSQEQVIKTYLQDADAREATSDISQVRYRGENEGVSRVRRLVDPFSKRRDFSETEWRELWLLLGSYERLFL